MRKTLKLRELFEKDNVIRIVGAHDGLSAKLVERNGFEGVWASGLEISTSYAVPDANILTMSQYLERACEMEEAVNIPVVADCDTGYGNVNNVIHMVIKYESAGIAAVCIEDKKFPKVNSFISGRQELAPIGEFVGKIMAAKNVQSTKYFMVIARVEALIAGWGQVEALKRANAYVDAGADAILIHSKSKNPDEIREFCYRWNKKAPLVIVPTTYPMIHIDEMPGLGVNMVIYANHGMRASIMAQNKIYSEIKMAGNLATINDMIIPMSDVFELQGMREMKEKEKKYLNGDDGRVNVIIPAAGDPSYEESMRDIVKDSPIAMLDINGKSILQRNVETLAKLNLFNITVIKGYHSEKFDVGGVSYIDNSEYANTSLLYSIMLAEKDLNGNTIIIFSDVLFGKDIIRRLISSFSDIVLVIDSSLPKKGSSIDYVYAKYPPIKGNRVMHQERENPINKIGKDLDSAEAQFEFTGISYFSVKGIEILKETYDEFYADPKCRLYQRKDFYQIIQRIIDKGYQVLGMEVTSGWMEIRNFENYKMAHNFFSGS